MNRFTVVGGNVLWNNDTLRRPWDQRVAQVVHHLLACNPALILVCEVDREQTDDIGARLGAGWSWWRFLSLAVFWRQDTFERQGEAANQLVYSSRENRRLLSMTLVHKATRQVVMADVTHLENNGDNPRHGAACRKIEATEFVAHTRAGRRVFFSDLNSTTPASSRDLTKPRPILARAGWHLLTATKGVRNAEYASHHGGGRKSPKGRSIDELGVKGGLSIVRGGWERTDQTDASDHNFPWAEIQL